MNDNTKSRSEKAGNARTIHRALYAVCAMLLAVDLVMDRYGHFAAETWFGFYAWYGFAACAAFVLIARGLRVILRRREDYYD